MVIGGLWAKGTLDISTIIKGQDAACIFAEMKDTVKVKNVVLMNGMK